MNPYPISPTLSFFFITLLITEVEGRSRTKAAEDGRTPKPSAVRQRKLLREASWNAAVLCRFLILVCSSELASLAPPGPLLGDDALDLPRGKSGLAALWSGLS